jgi:hypothetical protein
VQPIRATDLRQDEQLLAALSGSTQSARKTCEAAINLLLEYERGTSDYTKRALRANLISAAELCMPSFSIMRAR